MTAALYEGANRRNQERHKTGHPRGRDALAIRNTHAVREGDGRVSCQPWRYPSSRYPWSSLVCGLGASTSRLEA